VRRSRRLVRRPKRSPREEALAKSEAAAGGDEPLEGKKPKGGTSRHGASASARPRTSTETKPRKAGEDTAESSAAGPFEPTSGGEDRTERSGPCRGRGILRRAESQERTGLKHGRKVAGGTRRQEGVKPWRRSVLGRGKPGGVASRFRKRCRETNPGEACVAERRCAARFGQTPKESESPGEARDNFLTMTVATAGTGRPSAGR
jgi:hypothetical protein